MLLINNIIKKCGIKHSLIPKFSSDSTKIKMIVHRILLTKKNYFGNKDRLPSSVLATNKYKQRFVFAVSKLKKWRRLNINNKENNSLLELFKKYFWFFYWGNNIYRENLYWNYELLICNNKEKQQRKYQQIINF